MVRGPTKIRYNQKVYDFILSNIKAIFIVEQSPSNQPSKKFKDRPCPNLKKSQCKSPKKNLERDSIKTQRRINVYLVKICETFGKKSVSRLC